MEQLENRILKCEIGIAELWQKLDKLAEACAASAEMCRKSTEVLSAKQS